MANNASNALEERILSSIFVAADDLDGADVELALLTTVPADDSALGTAVEVTDDSGNYTRKTLMAKMTIESSGSSPYDTTAKNTAEISFLEAENDYSAEVKGVAIYGKRYGAASSQILFYGPLATNKTVSAGDTFKFIADALVITLA